MASYTVDYSEKEAKVLKWQNGNEPEEFDLVPFWGKEAEKSKKGIDEREFLQTLNPQDMIYLEAIGVNEVFCFLVSQRGAKILRASAPDLKKVRGELSLTKEQTTQVLYQASQQYPEIFRPYHIMDPERQILRRWVRIHYRFQRRFRTGVENTLTLLRKEMEKLLSFGYLKNSIAAQEVEKRIKEVLGYAQQLEDELLSGVKTSLKGIPLWEGVLKDIKGVGPSIGGKIVSIGPRSRFSNRDHYVATAGFHVKNGKAVRRIARQTLSRDPYLWDGVLQFIRNVHYHDSPWREVFLKKKEEYLSRGLSKGHADRSARRWVGTRFLREIWRQWKEVE